MNLLHVRMGTLDALNLIGTKNMGTLNYSHTDCMHFRELLPDGNIPGLKGHTTCHFFQIRMLLIFDARPRNSK